MKRHTFYKAISSHFTTSPPLLLVLFVGLESYVGPRSFCQEPGCFWPVSDHSVWAACESTACVSTLCVSTLCVSTLCVSTLCEHSMWPPYVSSMCEHSMCGHSMCGHSMCDHSMGALYVWARSSWAGCCRPPKSTKITTKNEHQFLGRMLQRQKRQKSTSFIVKPPLKSIVEHRKVRELPRKMNMEEVEAPKKYDNLQTKPVLDPFNRPSPQSTRITTKNEHRRSREAGNYENLQTKAAPVGRRHPKTTKIHRRNEHASTKPRK